MRISCSLFWGLQTRRSQPLVDIHRGVELPDLLQHLTLCRALWQKHGEFFEPPLLNSELFKQIRL
jgi:hypothetical protein